MIACIPIGKPTPALEPGVVIDHRYRIEQKIGRGGMGTVYRARQLSLGKPVAVKVLHATGDDTRSHRLRFLREATLTARIADPNVVRVFDHGTHHDLAYSIMEHLQGQDLARILRARSWLPWSRIRDVLVQTLRGLEAAYALGILHRDLKPSNLFLTDPHPGQPSRVKLLDFGLAKAIDSESARAQSLTAPDVVMGTVRYLAPERARGALASIRSEIYALGVLAFEALSGHVPLCGRRPLDTLRRRMREPAPSLRALVPGLSRDVDALVRRAMDPEPARRFGSLAELRAAVLSIPPDARSSDADAPRPPPCPAMLADADTVTLRDAAPVVARNAPPRTQRYEAASRVFTRPRPRPRKPGAAPIHRPQRTEDPMHDRQSCPGLAGTTSMT